MLAEEILATALSNLDLLAHLSLLAQDAAAEPDKTTFVRILENPLTPIVGLFFLFYFIFIVPEKRRKQEEAKMLSTLKKNARVVTIGGIHGTVVTTSSDSNVVTIRVDDNTRIKVNRSAIATVVGDKESQNEKNKDSSSETKDK